MAWGGGSSFSFGSVYRFLSSSIAAELKLDLSRVDQVITASNGRPVSVSLVQYSLLPASPVGVARRV